MAEKSPYLRVVSEVTHLALCGSTRGSEPLIPQRINELVACLYLSSDDLKPAQEFCTVKIVVVLDRIT